MALGAHMGRDRLGAYMGRNRLLYFIVINIWYKLFKKWIFKQNIYLILTGCKYMKWVN